MYKKSILDHLLPKLINKNALKVKNQIAWEDGFTFTYSY